MNTRVFKDISKYQHRAWLGFTTRQIIFVLPAFIVTIIVLGLNLFFWQFGDWFVYGFVFAFTIPPCFLESINPMIYILNII
ncbi:PrgI family protein [Streptococcus pneumoniae]|nr:PrgI family protein [Streptococcus pneumoniae]